MKKEKRVFIIAEAGINHNGDLKLAKELVDAAKESGADAVKFQIFHTESFYSIKHKGFEHTESDIYNLMRSLEFGEDEWMELKEFADKKGILFFASVFDDISFEISRKIAMPIYKIASLDITNFPLIKKIAKTKKPVIISTGFSTLDEISRAVKWIEEEKNKNISILHCVSLYPPKPDEVNLNFIKTLNKVFPYEIGFSDHTKGWHMAIAAVSLGAKIVEKHFTLDNNLPGPDQKLSLNKDDFNKMVTEIREVEKSFGDGFKQTLVKREKEVVKIARRGIYAKKKIGKGEKLTPKNIIGKRPLKDGIGIEFYNMILNRRVKRLIKEGKLIKFEDLE